MEANDLQSVVDQYLQIRGISKSARDIETHYGFNKDLNDDSSTNAWLEKMRTLFIRKGSGFSSRNVITGDGYKKIGGHEKCHPSELMCMPMILLSEIFKQLPTHTHTSSSVPDINFFILVGSRAVMII